MLLEAFLDLQEQAAEQAAGPDREREYAIPDTGDLAADLKNVLRATVDELLDPKFEVPSRALAAAGVVDEKLTKEFVARLLEPQLQLYVQRLESAQDAGQIRPDLDPRIALELFVSPSPSAGSRGPDPSRTTTRTHSSTTPCTASRPADPGQLAARV